MHMRTNRLAVAALLICSFASSEASAKDTSPKLFFAPALVEPLPELPAPGPSIPAASPTPAPATQDRTTATTTTVAPQAGTGFVLHVGSGVGVLAGEIERQGRPASEGLRRR